MFVSPENYFHCNARLIKQVYGDCSSVEIKLAITPSWIPISSLELPNMTLSSLGHVFMDFFASLNSRLI